MRRPRPRAEPGPRAASPPEGPQAAPGAGVEDVASLDCASRRCRPLCRPRDRPAAWRRRANRHRGPRGPPGSCSPRAVRAGRRWRTPGWRSVAAPGRASRRPTDHSGCPAAAVTSDREPLASLGATSREDGAAGAGAHAQAETVRLRTTTVVRLVRTLAHEYLRMSMLGRCGDRGARRVRADERGTGGTSRPGRQTHATRSPGEGQTGQLRTCPGQRLPNVPACGELLARVGRTGLASGLVPGSRTVPSLSWRHLFPRGSQVRVRMPGWRSTGSTTGSRTATTRPDPPCTTCG
jgi:hypothetical protein